MIVGRDYDVAHGSRLAYRTAGGRHAETRLPGCIPERSPSSAPLRSLSVKTFLVAVAIVALTGCALGSSTVSDRPTEPEIQARTRAAVAASGAHTVSLRLVPPNRSYSLTVRVSHPARYLRYRVNRLLAVVNRLTKVQWNFEARSITVIGPHVRAFWYEQARTAGVERTHWNVRPALLGCIRRIDLGIEVDPYNAAPPCPT